MFQRKPVIESIVNNLQSIKRVLASGGHTINKGLGITMTQANVLFLIKHKGTMNVTEIANDLGVTKSAATQLIDGLVRQNFLARETDMEDHRILKINLSDASHKRIANLRGKTVKMLSAKFDILSDKELVSLAKITQKLLENNNGVKEC